MPLRYNNARKNLRRASRRKSAKGFSLNSLRPKNVKNYLHDLFTTKEGWKKIGIVALIFFGIVLALFGWYAKDLPTPDKINNRLSAQTTQIYDRNGKLLYEMHGDKNRILVEYNDIPANVKNATIAIEDKNFYKEKGFSATRILGGAFYSVMSGGKKLQGGSTITQQFVKNSLLTNEQSIPRKIKELILSIEIEQMYAKNDILKMYLNEIPYGSNAYGVQVASKTYFNKDVKDVTLAEAAILAALPQAPSYYSPFGNHKDALMSRKNVVLDQMAAQGYITKKQAADAKKEKIAFSNNPYGSITAPHFVMYVKEQLESKYGTKMAEEGGLKVYTSLDLEKQKAAEAAIAQYGDKNAANYNASNAALVSIDPKTGQLLAMVGSRDFFNNSIDGSVNVTTMSRQPGSSFKPFAYATAWKKPNWGPGSTIYDFKTDFGGGYNPSNYDGRDHGVQSMRTALDGSLNIPAVKSLYIAGMDETLKTVHAMGITTLNDPSKYGLSLVLGAGEVKPVDMATAYGVFANGGVYQDPTWFVKIADSKGKTLDEYKKKPGKQVLDPQIAYLMSNVLSDNNARAYIFGSRNFLTLPDRPVSVKTGTTNDNKDAWTVGYTPSIATAVWVGNNDGRVMTKGADGSIVAAPIWQTFMKAATKGTPVENYVRPAGVKTVTLDAITGRAVTAATKQTRTDLFPSWFKVLGVNGQASTVQVNKLNNKIVNPACTPPAEAITTVSYSPITAEIEQNDPAYFRWFAPIKAWAERSGFSTDSSSVPTVVDDCSIYTGQNLPTVTITYPGDGDSVAGTFTVHATVATPAGFSALSFNVGGKDYAATASGTEYTAVITLPVGSHTLTATVKDQIFQTAKDTANITVK
jgi:1A family penicillin-binding protein